MITSLTLEQTVLAVFRPRPDLPSAVPPHTSRSHVGGGGRGGASGSSSEGVQGDVRVVPEGEGWSIASLLLPLKSNPSGAALADMVQVGGCPVATRGAIHVVGGGSASGGAADAPPVPGVCAASDEGCDAPGAAAAAAAAAAEATAAGKNVFTRLLSPLGADDEKGSDGGEPTLESPSMSGFLQAKLWDAGDTAAAGSTPAAAAAAAAAAEGLTANAPAVARLDHFLSGRGGTRGVSVAHLVNMHPTSGASVDFLQPVPYFMEPLLGTLRARSVPASSSLAPLTSSPENAAAAVAVAAAAVAGPLESLARNVTLTPGEGRRPAVVEARVWVPAASTVVLGFDFFKRFLTVDDFPPDPSRGFDVPPPLARFSFFADGAGVAERRVGAERGVGGGAEGGGDGGERPGETGAAACAARGECEAGPLGTGEGTGPGRRRGRGGRVVYAYGEAGLLDTPQPDFSMPFNVITFTSTVITFFLGTAINLLVRKSNHNKKRKKKGGGKGLAEKDGDESERPGEGAGGEKDAAGRRSLFSRARGALLGALEGVFRRRRGWTAAGPRIHKENVRLKDD